MTLPKEKVDALYRELGPVIYARCCRLLKNRSAAEDATQDIFVKLLRSEALPVGESRLPWVHRVTVNHCLNALRNERRRPSSCADGLVPDRPAEGDPEESFIEHDFSARLLGRMPEQLREPAELFHKKGMDQGRIAAWLGVSRRTVLYRLAEFNARAARFAANAA
jgi:RNA polymerase sigma-70 factor, ECF subfamily